MSRCEENIYVKATKIAGFGEIPIFFLNYVNLNILRFRVC